MNGPISRAGDRRAGGLAGAQPRHLRLAMAQIDTVVGDLSGNAQRILTAARAAYDAGANVALFPELAITGYPPEDLLLKPSFVEGNLAALREVAEGSRALADMTLVVGYVDRDVDIYNAAGLLRNGEQVGIYHKHYLPNYGVFDEDRYFRSGTRTPVFVIDGVTVGISICEDIWHPSGPPTTQALAGAEVLLNLSASPFYVGKQMWRERMLATRAADVGAIVAYCNLVGGQDELVFDGASVIFDGNGGLVARARPFEEDLLLVDLDVEDVFRTRLHQPLRRQERDETLQGAEPPIVISTTPVREATPPAVSVPEAATPSLGQPGRIEPLLSRQAESYAALVLGTGGYVRKNGFKTAIIALSGGIDSALTAMIAVDALGAEAVVGVSMPSRYSSAGSSDDARVLAENLGIRYLTLPIEAPFAAMLNTITEPFARIAPSTSALTEENLQARIRGMMVMALSNQSGGIVLTTGNKSEMAVGYATLYGDMAGGFAVLKDVFKTVVYDLARWRNAKAGRPLIPVATIEKPPSAELRPGQQDTDSLPPYDVLDPILRAYVEEDRTYEGIVALGFDPTIVSRVLRMVDRSEYKRRQAPPGVKITGRAFGRDRRLPITNRSSESSAEAGTRRQVAANSGTGGPGGATTRANGRARTHGSGPRPGTAPEPQPTA